MLVICILMIILLLIYAGPAGIAAKDAITLFLTSVLPSLLPFYIVSNLMLANPSAKKISKIFEPVMRRLFNVPGIGAGAFVLGTVCGFPSGAIACSDMYTKGYLTQSEAERLSSFTSNAGPVFIVGAVGASMFGSVYIGFLLMAVHIAAGIIVGISFRFKDADSRNYKTSGINTKYDELKPTEPFGKTMSDSIIKSVNTSLLVGGFIVIFAVIICILRESGVLRLLTGIFPGSIRDAAEGAFCGLIEMTTGCSVLAKSKISIEIILPLTSFIMGFSGISVLMQVIAVLSKAGIRCRFFIIGKLLQGAFSAALSFLIVKIPAVRIQLLNGYYEASSINTNRLYIDKLLTGIMKDANIKNAAIILLAALSIFIIIYKLYKHYFMLRRSS